MSDPLALLPYALAAADAVVMHGTRAVAVRAAVAAGFTLLQRAPVLVRTLGVQPVTACLPLGVPWITALAISDGRGLAWVPSVLDPSTLRASAGARPVLFTDAAGGAMAPADALIVLLDDAPRSATIRDGTHEHRIDLGSHVGIDLTGDPAAEGREERCLSVEGRWYSHRELLRAVRGAVRGAPLPEAPPIDTLVAWLATLMPAA